MASADPFRDARTTRGVMRCPFQGEELPMLLRHEDVRNAARDWRTFSSDAPFRVPIPSEESVRSMRQLPIETDPPDHGDYRDIVAPFFKEAKEAETIAWMHRLIGGMLADALARPSIEVVREFALPIQSRALTHLLRMPEAEAEIWIGWGIHVFHDGSDSHEKGSTLERYLHAQFDRATAAPGDDFFSALTQATFRGRALTRDEMMGFANLTFAGGRDTIIHTISSVLAYFAGHPDSLAQLRADPRCIPQAAEEFFRWVSPLTHLARVCPVETTVLGETIPANGRVSLNFASANRDATVFDEPERVQFDRRPNPHVAFGTGTHFCLGAPHARLILRTLLEQCVAQLDGLTVLAAHPKVEREARYERQVGYEALTVRLASRSA
ncbi:MAG: cytochrome P450 [Gemmatimonadaceae bacterium]|nr:cytochrome P450 [Gemmatimonadaceae bacterium]